MLTKVTCSIIIVHSINTQTYKLALLFGVKLIGVKFCAQNTSPFSDFHDIKYQVKYGEERKEITKICAMFEL